MYPDVEEVRSADMDGMRHELWQRRLRREALDEAQAAPGEGFTRELLAWGLRFTGLYNRGVRNADSPVLRRLDLRFPRLPQAFDGFRLLHVSDLHFDDRPGFLDSVCELVGSVETDVCLLTGDYRYHCHGACDTAVRSIKRLMAAFRTRRGVFAILGNHDSSSLVEPYRALGVRWLINENVMLREKGERIALLGLDDNRYFRTHSLSAAMDGLQESQFKILLAHSPQIHKEAEQAGVDLCLCGHTHAGQIRLPVLGAPFRNDRAPRRMCAGYWRSGDLQGHTSAGIGSTSVPVRFNCPPEATLIRLYTGT